MLSISQAHLDLVTLKIGTSAVVCTWLCCTASHVHLTRGASVVDGTLAGVAVDAVSPLIARTSVLTWIRQTLVHIRLALWSCYHMM